MAGHFRRVAFLCSLVALTSCGSVRDVSQVTVRPQPPGSDEALVWSDEFNSSSAVSEPDPNNWVYMTAHGAGTEVETYCGWQQISSVCTPNAPNEWVGSDGYLHIVARAEGNEVFTSGRLMTQGLRSFQYGRIEARIRVPDGEAVFPAFWMVGNNRALVGWPACGEIDIMEYRGPEASSITGSTHGNGFTGTMITNTYSLPGKAAFSAGFHTYGIIWSPGKLQFYVDDPSSIYATETPSSLPAGASWPFDSQSFYIIVNLAIRRDWGDPQQTTTFPQEMLVDYVRVYQEQGS
jgi:beta-glucanase (GH16 family)